MHVTSDTILEKMLSEVTEAKSTSQNKEKLTHHLVKIKLLCELLLEEHPPKQSSTERIKQMLSNDPKQSLNKVDDDQEDDSTSIFDF